MIHSDTPTNLDLNEVRANIQREYVETLRNDPTVHTMAKNLTRLGLSELDQLKATVTRLSKEKANLVDQILKAPPGPIRIIPDPTNKTATTSQRDA